ncbi:MAG TPA: hypothetical protein DEA43_02125 [Candidatus Moranbacteria bacterium]|nr:hypothetical protein [Candidatus Moranbacteria bacterium]HBT45661.1 hypothetical protein [Candidatus Moranbacteria bacterium]
MDVEIDFLPVGENSQSGDAIILRYGNLNGSRNEYSVVVIDAGFRETGEQVVRYLADNYQTDHVDLIVSTHPDNDHSAGILVLLEKISVGKIWMHKPWNHTANISELFKHHAVSDAGVERTIKKSLQTVKTIEQLAEKMGVAIVEPFTGLRDEQGGLLVLGPDEEFYKNELLPNFRCTPEPVDNSLAKIISDELRKFTDSIKEFVDEKWEIETLDHGGTTSAENNSSTILHLSVGEDHFLFTGDAGQPALERVIVLLDSYNYDYSKIKLKQVPHHGSHRNVNPLILDKLIGPKLPKEESEKVVKYVIVSVSKEENEKHPSKIVTNAYKRRGGPVYTTREGFKYYGSNNAPRRNAYGAVAPLPFFDKVEKHND